MGILLATIFLMAGVLLLSSAKFFRDPKILILSPVAVFATAWAASGLIYMVGEDFIREDTVWALLAFYLAFVIPGLWLTSGMSRWAAFTQRPVEVKRPRALSTALIAMQALAALAAISYLVSAMVYAGMDIDALNMSALRGVLATQKYDVPLPFRLLSQLRYVNYFAPIAMLALFRDGHISRRRVTASIVLACLYPLCFLERSGLMRILILTLFGYLFMYEVKARKLLRLGALLAVLATVFVIVVPIIRGQGGEGGGNLYTYVAGAWSGFDNFVSGSGVGSVVVLEDQEVFVKPGGYDVVASDSPAMVNLMTEAYRLCNAVELCDVKIANFGEYVYDPIYTNIYTAARSFYQDLGMLGMIPAVMLVSVLFSAIYLWAVRNASVAAIYAAAYVAYTCVMSVLSDTFLLRDLVFPFAMMYALAWFFGGRELWFGKRRSASDYAGAEMAH